MKDPAVIKKLRKDKPEHPPRTTTSSMATPPGSFPPDISPAGLPNSQHISPIYPGKDVDLLMNEASELAQGLNVLMLMDLNELQDLFSDSGLQVKFDEAVLEHTSTDELLSNDSIEMSIAAFDMIGDQKNYLRLFYEKYSLWLMSLAPAGDKNFCSKILISHALKTPFLMNAVISITASYEYFLSNDEQDFSFKKHYLNQCLKNLNQVFESNDKVAQYIEPLILTSLLLVTDTVATLNGAWRAHLKGANDLFKKYVGIYKPMSPTIILATTWFASFEFIAVLTNPLGGAINTQHELDDILNPVLYLNYPSLAMQSGFLLPSGYNVFLGHSSQATTLYITFVKISLKIRTSAERRIDPQDLSHLISLIHTAQQYQLISGDVVVDKENPYYPNTQGLIYMPQETYGYLNDLVYSWYDLSDKVHVQAVYLLILTNELFLGLPRELSIVQKVVQTILGYCFFFHGIDLVAGLDFDAVIRANPALGDRRLMMCHSLVLMAGIHSLRQVDRLKVELFFWSLHHIGVRSAKSSLEKLKKLWSGALGALDYVPYL